MNDLISCTLIDINNFAELSLFFEIINKDSFKNKNFVNSNIFEKKVKTELKSLLRENFGGCYKLRKSEKNYIMTIDEFIEDLDEYGAFENWNNGIPAPSYFYKKIEKYNKIFFDDISYCESLDNVNAFYVDESEIIIKYKNCVFFKNNNFRECFCEFILKNIKTSPYHEYKSIRDKISSKLKSEVWKKEFKTKKLGKCPVLLCNNMLEKKSFHCGHIISCHNNGQNEIENLRPICGDCNTKMSSENWVIYEKKNIYEKKKQKCYECKQKIKCINNINIINENIYCHKCFDNLSDSSSDSDNIENKNITLSSKKNCKK
jgi:hypothetical protein